MTDDGRVCESWDEVIKSFLQRKSDAEEEKYLKKRIDEIKKVYETQKYFGNNEIKFFFDPKKNKKKDTETSLNFQWRKIQKIFELEKQPEQLNEENFREEVGKKCEEIKNKYESHRWLSKAAQDAKSVSFATHVFKLTHSKIDSNSLFDQIKAMQPGILSTSDLKNKVIDGAVAGNQFAPVYQFLELEHDGKKMVNEFENMNSSVLKNFAKSDEELSIWNDGFRQALVSSNPSTHSLAKQIYFPIKKVDPLKFDSYHLLANVKSSSFAQAIFEKQDVKNQTMVRKLRDKNKFSSSPFFFHAKKAIIKVTQSNHGNASQLNGKRGGRLILFNSQPPVWASQIKPPITKFSLFHNVYGRQSINDNIDYLRDFFLRFERIEISVHTPERKKWILHWAINIIEEIFLYAVNVHRLPSGWSNDENIKLKKEHQYFLDPFRDDAEFQSERVTVDWQTVICNDFASWLNGRLKGKDKKFTPQREHTRMWKKIMKEELRKFSETVNLHLQNKTEAVK